MTEDSVQDKTNGGEYRVLFCHIINVTQKKDQPARGRCTTAPRAGGRGALSFS